MREMFCRGKSVNSGSWIYGYYCKMDETTHALAEDYKTHPVRTIHLIAQDSMTDWGLPNKLQLYEVDPDTVGQYTGLNDRMAKRIYEGDILLNEHTGEKVSVWWNEGCCCFECRGGETSPVQVGSLNGCSRVIGNVFDNKEVEHGH